MKAARVLHQTRKTLFLFSSASFRNEVVTTEVYKNMSGVVAAVFGATGFSGRYVVSRLGDLGSQIIIPYRGTENVFRHLKVVGELGQIVPIACDVNKIEEVEVEIFLNNFKNIFRTIFNNLKLF